QEQQTSEDDPSETREGKRHEFDPMGCFWHLDKPQKLTEPKSMELSAFAGTDHQATPYNDSTQFAVSGGYAIKL
ncbi:MAG: hypothetical protein WCI73_05125, partial [Phycisphaerae bacterium]